MSNSTKKNGHSKANEKIISKDGATDVFIQRDDTLSRIGTRKFQNGKWRDVEEDRSRRCCYGSAGICVSMLCVQIINPKQYRKGCLGVTRLQPTSEKERKRVPSNKKGINETICSIIITSKEYIGDPIHCIVNSNIDQKAINTYCWIASTFTVTANPDQSDYFQHLVPYPGVRNEYNASAITHQKYYQWVCFILAIQAAVFFFPHCLWKVWEGGRIKMLVADLCTPVADKWTPEKKQQTIEFFSKSGFYNLNLYALQFLFCEFLNVINIILQIFIWNQVLDHKFLSFGPDAIIYASSISPYDPISTLFPKITKCNFHYYGPSGSSQQIDAVCVLPLNIVNEKMFTFLWFWFFLLAVVTVTAFLFDVLLFNRQLLRIYILQAQARFVSRAKIRTIVTKRTMGHWFLLHQLGRNMNPFVFCDLLTDLASVLDERKFSLKEQTDV